MRASDGHHHLSAGNVIPFEKLSLLFGGSDDTGVVRGSEMVGDRYQDLLQEITAITEYQWRSGTTRGLVKGFMLSGPPGTGKTTLAKRVAYELGRRFEAENEPPVALAFVDGGEISRSRYGESEERIRDIFLHARSGFTAQGQRSVLLFDDVESIFMARGSQHAKEWHFSQDSVFFHSIDDLDTSRATIILTSNRPDLIDEAIRDRFLSYVVDYPDLDTLLQMVQQIPAVEQLSGTQQSTLKKDLIAAVKNGTVRSMRDGQRFAMRHFVAKLLKKDSLAQQIAE
ncbi:MAG TPA: ATP-binding protein [Candidatus Limnocylindrales bacterium]|nr:ATP-binding protein [Candidatus Limnocylindrales bacterium]